MQSKALHTNNELFTDYRAVTRAASLIAQGVDINSIELVPVGGSSRAYAKEIERSFSYVSERSAEKRYRIEINREGIYDMLPEGLFHTLVAGTEVLDEDIMVEDIQQKRQEEKEARQFFLPFEIELNHLRLLLEGYENRLDMQTSFNDMSDLLLSSWPELSLLNNRQRVIWMHFIPEIQQHKNDLPYIEEFLNLLLEIPVRVQRKFVTRPLAWIDESLQREAALGRGILGVNTITSQTYEMDVELIEIQLGPTYPQLLQAYLPNASDERIIDMTLDYLLPADVSYQLIYDLLPELKATYLHDLPEASQQVLGHTSYL